MPLFSDTVTCVHIRAALLPSSLDPVQCVLALVAVMGHTPSPSRERLLWFIRSPHELPGSWRFAWYPTLYLCQDCLHVPLATYLLWEVEFM